MQNSTRIFIIPEMKIADIIIGNPYLLLMMEHLEINLEVREKTIEQICIDSNINTDLFITISNLFNGFKPTPLPEYSQQNIQTIISYLENSHQYYLKDSNQL